METSEVLVTGGTGSLGQRVTERLRVSGREVRVLSRSGRAGTVSGDLLTGAGLKEAVRGVDTIVHCASSPTRKTRQTDVDGTQRLLRAAERAEVSHFAYISIVGVDRSPFSYYQVKLEAEKLIERSGLPCTILRSTQFHEFVLGLLKPLARLPLMPVPKGFRLQPVDVGEVADRLVELALSEPAGRAPDMGGPEVSTAFELAHTYLKATGQERRVVKLPVPGGTARAFREGAHTCPEHAYGSITWEEFLHGRVQA